MSNDFAKYQQLQNFAINHQKYIAADPFLDKNKFLTNMQIDEYVRLKFTDSKGHPVFIYLFSEGSPKISKVNHFIQLIKKLPKNPATVLLIPKVKISSYVAKALIAFPYLTFKVYLHKNFLMNITKGPKCAKHKLLTAAEKKQVLNNDLMSNLITLPAIRLNDPQVLWLPDAKIGDVVKITTYSDKAGEVITYRVVIPSDGKFDAPATVEVVEEPEEEPPDELHEFIENTSDIENIENSEEKNNTDSED